MPKGHTVITAGSTVTIQRKNARPWIHGTLTKHDDEEHSGWSYKISITMMVGKVTRTVRYVRQRLISSEKYLQDQIINNNENISTKMSYIDNMNKT